MKISIVTPVLNGSQFLPDLITCLSAQNHTDWEHIIVDGGSTDESLKISRDWIEKDKRAKLIEAPDLGLYPSILHGFDHAKGDFLAWLASDDIYTPWAFSSVVEHHQRTNAEWITGFPGAWDSQGRLRYIRPYGKYPQSWIRRGWFHSDFIGHLQQESMFFSRTLLDKLTPHQLKIISSTRLAGDFMLWRYFATHTPLEVTPTALAGFRFHGTNLSVSGAGNYADEVRETGAPFPHPRLARLMEKWFRRWSALNSLKIMRQADGILFTSQAEESPSPHMDAKPPA